MDKTNKIIFYEEITNAITHGIGFVLSIVALIFLIKTAVAYGDVWYIVSFSIYGASSIILYLAS